MTSNTDMESSLASTSSTILTNQSAQTQNMESSSHESNASAAPVAVVAAALPQSAATEVGESPSGRLNFKPHQLAHKFFINTFLHNQHEMQQHHATTATGWNSNTQPSLTNINNSNSNSNSTIQNGQAPSSPDEIANHHPKPTTTISPTPPHVVNGKSVTNHPNFHVHEAQHHSNESKSNVPSKSVAVQPPPQPPQPVNQQPQHQEEQQPAPSAPTIPQPSQPPQQANYITNINVSNINNSNINNSNINNNNTNSNLVRQRQTLRKRKSFAAVTRKQVEGMIAFRFVSSHCGKQAMARPSNFATSPSKDKHTHNHEAPRFNKFSLVYNECSLAAIGKWVWGKNNDNNNPNQPATAIGTNEEDPRTRKTPTVIHRPTAAVIFRKCSLCHKFGHYDIECSLLDKDEAIVISLAQDVRIQKSLQDISTAATDAQRNKYDDAADEGDLCVFCESRGNQKLEQKTCAGCQTTAHIQCIIPSIKADRVWYCSGCAYEPHRVRTEQATVELESCQGFVIEQRTRPRNSGASTADEFDFALERGWQTVVGVRAETEDSNGGKRRRFDDEEEDEEEESKVENDEEVTELGEFCIKAHRGNMGAEFSMRDALLRAPLKPGCIVAWYPPAPSSDETSNTVTTSYDPMLGVVMAVSPDQELVLVRPVASWESVMQYAEELTKQNNESQDQQQQSSDAWQILAIRANAARWMSAAMVHIVKRAPSKAAVRTFLQEVLPKRLAQERQQLYRQRAEAAMKKVAPSGDKIG